MTLYASFLVQTVRITKTLHSGSNTRFDRHNGTLFYFRWERNGSKSVRNSNQTFRRTHSPSVSKPVKPKPAFLLALTLTMKESFETSDYYSKHLYHRSFPIWNKKGSYSVDQIVCLITSEGFFKEDFILHSHDYRLYSTSDQRVRLR